MSETLIRSRKACTAVQDMAVAVLDRGRVDGGEVDALCSTAIGEPFVYDRCDGTWPPTPAQIRGELRPVREARQAA